MRYHNGQYTKQHGRRSAHKAGMGTLLALGLMALLALAACGGSGGSGGSGSGSSGASGAGGSSNPQTQARTILQHVQQANLKSAHVNSREMLKSQQGDYTSSSTGVITLNPYQLDWQTTTQASGQTIASQEIVANNNLYVKTAGSSTWSEIPLSQATSQAKQSSGQSSSQTTATPPSLDQIVNLTDAKLVGTQTMNGVKVYHIHGQGQHSASASGVATPTGTATGAAQNVAYTEDLYVRTDNYQPVEVVLAATTSKGVATSTTMFSQWNTPVTITPPPANAVSTQG